MFYVAARQHAPNTTTRTVLFDSIPDDCMFEKALTSQLEVFPNDIITNSFTRDYSAVSRLVARRDRLAGAFKATEAVDIKKAFRGGVQKTARRSSPRERKRSSCQSQSMLDIFA